MSEVAKKVYRVVMPYFDGDHSHGFYESPLFARREDAERFLQALIALPTGDKRRWWTDAGSFGAGPEEAAWIEELEVVEHWDGNLKPAKDYVRIAS